jgi:hypothetical protein
MLTALIPHVADCRIGRHGVPYSQTLEMADKLKAAGVKHELIILPGVNHGFIGNTPDQTREANLKALEATFRFIDKTAGKSIATQPPWNQLRQDHQNRRLFRKQFSRNHQSSKRPGIHSGRTIGRAEDH